MEDIQYVKNRVRDIMCEFGDGDTEFNTKDINRLYNQLEIEEQQNEMLIQELTELRAENERLKEKEILGDRKIVELEHEKTVLKSLPKLDEESVMKIMDDSFQWSNDVPKFKQRAVQHICQLALPDTSKAIEALESCYNFLDTYGTVFPPKSEEREFLMQKEVFAKIKSALTHLKQSK